MSEKTAISWTDSTVGFWSGCTKVSPGCAICWAEQRDRRHLHEPVSHWGKGAPRFKHKGAVKSLMAMNRKPWVCDGCGGVIRRDASGILWCATCGNYVSVHRRKVFINQQSDWLDPEVPIQWLAEMLDTIRQCPELDIMLLTKRPELWFDRLYDEFEIFEGNLELANWVGGWLDGIAPPNVMIGATVEDQKRADERIPELLQIPAKFRFLSVEPQLEDIVFPSLAGINLLINGGESGPNARPFKVQWARHLRDQCKAAGVGFYLKQMGANVHEFAEYAFYKGEDGWRRPRWSDAPGDCMVRLHLQDQSGADPSEWPEDLRVQEPFSIQR